MSLVWLPSWPLDALHCVYVYPGNQMGLYGYPIELSRGSFVPIQNSSPHPRTLLSLWFYMAVRFLAACLL